MIYFSGSGFYCVAKLNLCYRWYFTLSLFKPNKKIVQKSFKAYCCVLLKNQHRTMTPPPTSLSTIKLHKNYAYLLIFQQEIPTRIWCVQGMFHNCSVLPFGSSVNGFGKYHGDQDMILSLNGFHIQKVGISLVVSEEGSFFHKFCYQKILQQRLCNNVHTYLDKWFRILIKQGTTSTNEVFSISARHSTSRSKWIYIVPTVQYSVSTAHW